MVCFLKKNICNLRMYTENKKRVIKIEGGIVTEVLVTHDLDVITMCKNVFKKVMYFLGKLKEGG